jgi:hypothetical protein
MSRENEVLLENPKADVQFELSQWTYGLEPGHTAQSVTGNFIFTKPSHSSYFPYSRVFLVEIRLIEGFPQIWRTRIVRNFRRRVTTQVSFNLHNA